jgi:hypothetical protein
MNKARPALNENQPRVEQEMLWAGLLKVKRCNYRMAFWNQFILEPTSGLPFLFGTNFRGRWKNSLRCIRGVDIYSTVTSSTYLVESQEKVLLMLSTDFNRYLTFKPQAHLILQGHADHRGAPSYNKELTERRVERTSNFLTSHGVPSANIETRSLGDEDNLTPEQVKNLVDNNPELSNDERRKIEGNLRVIVWANNRRVDVSLNTTGQQSVRQYPFNAKDSLTLLSPSGGEAAKHAKAPKKTHATPVPVKGKSSE